MATYYYHGDTETYHPKLNLLKPGANEIPDDLIGDAEMAVESGLLSHDEAPPEPPQADEAPSMEPKPDAHEAHTMGEPSAPAEDDKAPEEREERA